MTFRLPVCASSTVNSTYLRLSTLKAIADHWLRSCIPQLVALLPSALGFRGRAAFRLANQTTGLAFSDMAAIKEPDSLDAKFYKPAYAFFSAYSNIGLTFDDVTLATLYSEVLPTETQLDTHLADGLHLNIPIISSDMD